MEWEMPRNRMQYKQHLEKVTAEDPDGLRYPTIDQRYRAGQKEDAETKASQAYYQQSMTNNILQSWIFKEELNPEEPMPKFQRIPRQLRLFSSEQQQQHMLLESFYEHSVMQNDQIPHMVVLLPVFIAEMKTPTLRGVLICTKTEAYPVDFADELSVQVFKKILQKNYLLKFCINAEKEMPLYWAQLDAAPVNIGCLTTAALRIMDELQVSTDGIKHELRRDKMSLFPFETFFKVNLKTAHAMCASTRGMKQPSLLVSGTKLIHLLELLMVGVGHVQLKGEETWKSVFRFNRLNSIHAIGTKGLLTDYLGLNFWPAMDQCLQVGLRVDVFVLSFLYKNFGWSEENDRDPGFTSCEFIYNAVMLILNEPDDFTTRDGLLNPVYQQDSVLMDVNHFKFLTCNYLLKRVSVPSSTDVGTLGEMLRRVRNFAPCLLD